MEAAKEADFLLILDNSNNFIPYSLNVIGVFALSNLIPNESVDEGEEWRGLILIIDY